MADLGHELWTKIADDIFPRALLLDVVEHELWASSSLSDSTVLTELFLLPPNSSFLFKLAGADW